MNSKNLSILGRVKKVAVLIMPNYDKHLDNEGTVVQVLNKLIL